MSAEDFESRLAALEARVAALEAPITEAPPVAPPTSPAITAVSSQPTSPQPRPSVPHWQTVMPPGQAVDHRTPLVPPSPAGPSISTAIGDLEERLAGRALAVTGGIALILGAIFFLSLAFSRGWIGPELRVVMGLVAGVGVVAAGGAFLERRNALLGNVLTPVGLAIISISLVGATRLYHLVPVEVGLVGALLSAAAVAVIAVRNDSQLVAGFGLVSVLIAPPLLGASADSTTLAFVGDVLFGTTSIALWRSWSWLPPVAFLLTALQAASWIAGDPPVLMALVGIAAYWALNLVAAGGEEFRRHRDDLSPSASTLLLGNAAFLVWAGFTVLTGDLADLRGLFLIAVAVAHMAVGGWFVVRHGDHDLFGLLTLATGIAALTMAMPIQLGAPAVPVAWTAEAAVLLWVAVRRGHPYSLAVSGILYALAALAIVGLYPFGAPTAEVPFLDERGAALAFFLAGVVLGVWMVRDRSLRSALATLGLLVAVYVGSALLRGIPFVFLMSTLMVVAASTYRALPRLPNDRIEWRVEGLIPVRLRGTNWRAPLDQFLPAMIVGVGTIAAAHIATVELPVSTLTNATLPAIPFTDDGSIAAGILIGATLASGWILGGVLERGASVLTAGAIVFYVIPFEVPPWAVTVLWVALGVVALVVARRFPAVDRALEGAGGIAIGLAGLVAVGDVAPLSRLIVGPVAVEPPQIVATVVALASVALGAVALGRSRLGAAWSRWLGFLAAALTVYLLSVLAIDIVGLRIGGETPLDELETQGQVVLSVLWAALGLAGLMYGIRSGSRDLRLGGLALLGIATIKVFLFDLAALDVAYRVISFIALGILLLVSAWLWQRAQPKPVAPAGAPFEDSGSA
jgi:uncharacterized membrane protein